MKKKKKLRERKKGTQGEEEEDERFLSSSNGLSFSPSLFSLSLSRDSVKKGRGLQREAFFPEQAGKEVEREGSVVGGHRSSAKRSSSSRATSKKKLCAPRFSRSSRRRFQPSFEGNALSLCSIA